MPYYFDKKRKQHCLSVFANGKQHLIRSRLLSHERFKSKNDALGYEPTIIAYYNNAKARDSDVSISTLEDVYYQFLSTISKITTVYTRMQVFKKYILTYFANYSISKINNDLIIKFNDYLNNLSRRNKKIYSLPQEVLLSFYHHMG